ncbi:acyl carrier protein [Hymenobacter sp. BT188]|uniref:acyl carrier protein n=1 Tax=Hymenobacter sp. BT188 TaxID=2763504 RepID=UPI0016510DDB|nr:acyl carrier protein [Hymenobacter sp. BT188]MBC6608582.1 acyl carrier protein [Hymenobacter sp. BT188]
MISSSTSVPSTIEQQVLRIISKRKAIKPTRLRIGSNLSRELGFDTVDVVDIILELERSFKITIPDEVPLSTVGDFVSYVASHTPKIRQVA